MWVWYSRGGGGLRCRHAGGWNEGKGFEWGDSSKGRDGCEGRVVVEGRKVVLERAERAENGSGGVMNSIVEVKWLLDVRGRRMYRGIKGEGGHCFKDRRTLQG